MNMMNTALHPVDLPGPQWLKAAGAADRLRYANLEDSLSASRAELVARLGTFASLEAYARQVVGEALQKNIGHLPELDRCKVHSRYGFNVAGRTIVQEDTLAIADMLVRGLHDPMHEAQLSVRLPGMDPEVNPAWLMELLSQDARAEFAASYREAHERSDVLAAMKDVLRNRLLLSALAARLQDHLSDANLARIERALAGDAALTVASLRLLPHTRPLKDLVVIGDRTGDTDDWLLYAPGSPGQQDWYGWRSFRALNLGISGWLAVDEPQPGESRMPQANEAGCSYLSQQSHAMDRASLAGYLKAVPLKPANWTGVTLAPSPYGGDGVLDGLVHNERAWLIAQQESQAPYGYRTAPQALRQRFTRLGSELKALHVVKVRGAGLLGYERFCRDLIKQEAEALLLSQGQRISIDPDLIYVQISEQQRMTLTELIASETHFYADGAGQPLYPRFTLSGRHAPFTGLDIRHIAGWSRTLRPGEKYIDRLRTVDLEPSHPEGALKRAVHVGILLRQMESAALNARFSSPMPRTHIEEMNNVIEALRQSQPKPSQTVTLNGELPEKVRVSALFRLHLKGRLVVGVYVFRLVVDGKAEPYLFTPDAPDGRELRPFGEFVASVKSGGLGDYFCRRVAARHQAQVGAYLTDLEQLGNFTEAPALEPDSRMSDLGRSHEELIRQVISDVDDKTESLSEIIGRLAFDAVVTAVGAVGVVSAPIGIALGAFLFTKSLVQGVEAYSEGNRAKALEHLKTALIELASLGKAGVGKPALSAIKKDFIDLIGDVYAIEKLVAEAAGLPRLHERVLEAIQEVLDDTENTASRTTLI
ncbi:dermonecrotic toxin domain-containing protein [Pseudomonas sp. NPDC089534]|uniref:dermonecrotic toxin domain-containing protein n=1 Tax=Pseudomonas sp. NPDC089534 TaxID=3364468 RepID=UPI0037F70777